VTDCSPRETLATAATQPQFKTNQRPSSSQITPLRPPSANTPTSRYRPALLPPHGPSKLSHPHEGHDEILLPWIFHHLLYRIFQPNKTMDAQKNIPKELLSPMQSSDSTAFTEKGKVLASTEKRRSIPS
jgi:hypothetical protein